jgi:hypothetical protein
MVIAHLAIRDWQCSIDQSQRMSGNCFGTTARQLKIGNWQLAA